MDPIGEQVSSLLESSAADVVNHSSNLKKIYDLLATEKAAETVQILHNAMMHLILSKQVKMEAAGRLIEFLAKCISTTNLHPLSPEARPNMKLLHRTCVKSLIKASQAADNDIRSSSSKLLALIAKASLGEMSSKYKEEITNIYVERLEDKIKAIRETAEEILPLLFASLNPITQQHFSNLWTTNLSNESRSQVRTGIIKILPKNRECFDTLIKRTADCEHTPRLASLEKLTGFPISMFTPQSIYTLTFNFSNVLKNGSSSTGGGNGCGNFTGINATNNSWSDENEDYDLFMQLEQEQKAFDNLVLMCFKEWGGDLWKMLEEFPLENEYETAMLLISRLFAKGADFPSDFSERQADGPKALLASLCIAIVHCEKLAGTPLGRTEIEAFVPDTVNLAQELIKHDPDSTTCQLLLNLSKFVDIGDEHGRVVMEECYIKLLSSQPGLETCKLIISLYPSVQPIVQKFLDAIVNCILQHWILPDYIAPHANTAKTLELLQLVINSLPSRLPHNSPSLTTIENDILLPSSKINDTNVQAHYFRCLGAYSRFNPNICASRSQDMFQILKSYRKPTSLRIAAAVALVDWLVVSPPKASSGSPQKQRAGIMNNGEEVGTGADQDGDPKQHSNVEGEKSTSDPIQEEGSERHNQESSLTAFELSKCLLGIMTEKSSDSLLTFSAVTGIARLLYKNKIKDSEASIVAELIQLTFTHFLSDTRLRLFLDSFFMIFVSYPSNQNLIYQAVKQTIQISSSSNPHHNGIVSFDPTARKQFIDYVLNLLHESTKDDIVIQFKHNFELMKRCLKMIYKSPNEDILSFLKRIPPAGFSDNEIDVLESMCHKIMTQHLSFASKLENFLSSLKNPTSFKKAPNSSLTLPTSIKKSKKATSMLDHDVPETPTKTSRRRSHVEMLTESRSVSTSVLSGNGGSESHHSSVDQTFAELAKKMSKYDDYELESVSSNQKAVKTPVRKVKRRFETPNSKEKETSPTTITSKLSPETPATRNSKKPGKSPNLQDLRNNHQAGDLLSQLRHQYEGIPGASQLLKNLEALQPTTTNSYRTPEKSSNTKSDSIESQLVDSTAMEISEPSTSRAKRVRPNKLQLPSSGSIKMDRLSINGNGTNSPKSNNVEEEEDSFEPKSKKRKSKDSDESLSTPLSSNKKSTPPPKRQNAQLESQLSSSSLGRVEVQQIPKKYSDWKQISAKSLPAPSTDNIVVGFAGFLSSKDAAKQKELQKALETLKIESVIINSFNEDLCTHLVVCPGLQTRTTLAYAIKGVWMMPESWIDESCSKKRLITDFESAGGKRMKKQTFDGKKIAYTPSMAKDASASKFASVIVSYGGAIKCSDLDEAEIIFCSSSDSKDELWTHYSKFIVDPMDVVSNLHA